MLESDGLGIILCYASSNSTQQWCQRRRPDADPDAGTGTGTGTGTAVARSALQRPETAAARR